MGVLSGFDDITGWTLLQKNSAALETAYAADSSSATAIAYFKSVASTLTTPQALLSNWRALDFVTTAYGLPGQTDQTAILKKLLTQDPTSPSSLAQQLADPGYLKFAQALSNWSPPPFSTASGLNTAISNYQTASFQSSVGQDNTALQEAMVFTQNALGATDLTQLMASKPMLDVVTTALGIPAAFGNLDFDQQVAILKPRVNMSQFATVAGVASFVQKFLAMDQLNKTLASSTGSDPILTLFNGSGDGTTSPGLTLTASNVSSNSLNLLA